MDKRAVGSVGTLLTLLLLVIFASACSGNDNIKVTFDGDECVLSGPSDLETGAHLITADSDTELEWPPWCLGFPTSSVASAESNQVVYEYNLRYEGQYFVVWEQNEPDAVWPCAPLTVRTAVVQNNPDDDSFLLDKEENFALNEEYLRRSGSLSDGGR